MNFDYHLASGYAEGQVIFLSPYGGKSGSRTAVPIPY